MLFEGKKILVTGGTGFIGSHLVSSILKAGGQVSVLTRQEKKSDKINFITGEITDINTLKAATKNIDMIFHLAAYVDVTGAISNPRLDFETSAVGTFSLLEAAKENNIDKFIYVSSARVYGDPQYVPVDESHPLNPKELYGASRLVGETYCRVFHKTYGLKIVIVRPFSVYGPGRLPKEGSLSGVLTIFVRNAFAGKDLMITGDGTQTKDFTYISDVIDGLISAAINDECVGEAFNIGYGEGVSMNRLAELVIQKTNRDVGIKRVPQARESVSNYADISKANKVLNYRPKVSIEEGLAKYVAWYKKEMVIN